MSRLSLGLEATVVALGGGGDLQWHAQDAPFVSDGAVDAGADVEYVRHSPD